MAAYYHKHPDEKRRHNRNRYLVNAQVDSKIKGEEKGALVGKWNRPIVDHVRMFVSLIERRRVRRDEVVRMLKRISRQPRLTRRRRLDYVVRQLNKGPP